MNSTLSENSTLSDALATIVAEESPTPTSGILEEGFFGWLRGQDVWTAILRDCFQGQIITICLVAVFVVVFLIREWVMQNAVAVIDEAHVPQGGVAAVNQRPEEQPQQEMEQPQYQHWEAGMEVFQEQQEEEYQYAPDVDTLQDDPFQDEHRFPEWARQRTDYLVDPFGQPVPQAEDVEAAIAARQAEQQQYQQLQGNVLDPAPQQRPQNVPVPPPQNIAPLNFPANEFNIRRDFEDDELDGDDFDGLWDILGMQGPIIGLFHNTIFSALMIALAVGLGVWLPFMFGKTALGALVSSLSKIRCLCFRLIPWTLWFKIP
jgi:hypothetical protein